ncbi:MAG: S41 family peptidase [Bacteroides sp.]|nr:S41 family peptidase [Bacteroides sp.]MCM1378555.1 S41 family peptidase [Bacteroides sp.]MCM1444856.1 S41 family peptidase [Prevotella sp.]
MSHRKLIAIFSACFIGLGAAAQMQFGPAQKLQVAEHIIQNYYVDTLNVDRVVEQGIIAMLKELDPHSSYTTAAETKALTEPLNGNFSGIGVQFQMVQDTVYVIQTVAGGPSEKVGIIPGDRIVAANDTVIAGQKLLNTNVMKYLRGPKGTVVNLKVVRRSEPDTLVFRVKRDDIPLYTVDASYMADPQTGYIRITSFGAETAKEFDSALKELRKKGMKNLVIDLQDNGGGFLNASVEVAEKFLPHGATIVYTGGLKQPTQYFKSENFHPDTDGRIVVMVNEYSASASEILSGAMQDNDRGVIVGRRTFGKGLVQRPFPFPDGSMIRLTTAHYYTPSGRNIQKPYEKGKSDDYQLDIKQRYEHGEFYSADSIKLDKSHEFKTNSGRSVYGGGGIMPDKFVGADTTGINKYFRELRAKNVMNQYVVDYVENHRKQLNATYKNEDAFLEKFEVTPQMIDDFVALGEKLGVEPDTIQLEECKPFIVGNIKGLIGRDLFAPSTYYRVMNPMNALYKEALRLINDPEEYNSLLRP